MPRRHLDILILLAAAIAILMPGCRASRNPVPEDLVHAATIPGIDNARVFGQHLNVDAAERRRLYAEQKAASGLADERQQYLAISGGGANGAFGAGLMVGWTAAGNRPEFHFVTGVSTGALMAPFVFLGPEYDDRLETVYTSISSRDVFNRRNTLVALFGDALANGDPLRRLIEQWIDAEIVEKMAHEWHRGRRLFVGTTNLDSLEPVYWNIGAIAASGDPKALELIQTVLLASAAIPGALPPVFFDVEAGGETYDEMHVDGGVTSQVFLYPLSVNMRELLNEAGISPDSSMYIIRNAQLAPRWEEVRPSLFSIGGRSVSSLIRTQGFGDLFQIYLGSLRDEIEFNLAYIPDDFDVEQSEEFDPVYMRELFDLGYELGNNGYEWRHAPPGFEGPSLRNLRFDED